MDDQRRFWSKVKFDGPMCEQLGTRCWMWTGLLTPEGYGWFSIGRQHVQAHRFAYGKTGGDLDHRCHNRACVRTSHLRPVTRKQNLENRVGANSNNRSSGVRGVTWDRGRWKAQVMHHGKNFHVGRFATIDAATAAVVAKRVELFSHNDADRWPSENL